MTDTPDLRTLAAEALAGDEIDDIARRTAEQSDEWCVECVGRRQAAVAAASIVLAAVLPAHRRQVLAGAIAAVEAYRLDGRGLKRGVASGLDKAVEVLRRLASVAPETAPRPRRDDETAPAVPEATPAPKTDIWFDGYQAGHLDERAGLNRDAAVPDGPQLPDYHSGTPEERAAYWHGRAEAAWRREDEAGLALIRLHGELERARAVLDAAKVIVDHAYRSTAPRTPMFQALIDAVDALWVAQHTDATPTDGQA